MLSIAGEFGLWHWRATTANVRLFPPRCLHVWDTSCQFTSYQHEPAKLSAHLSFVSVCARAHLSCPCQLLAMCARSGRLLQVPHLGLLRCGPHARPRLPRGQPRVKVPWATWRELEEAAGTHVHAHMGVCDNCGNDSRPPPSPGSPLSTALFCLHLLCCDK